jgi:hypothetical protein
MGGQKKGADIGTPHGMRNEFALRSRTGVRASFMALTFASGSRAVPHATADDAGHDAFMTLPRYTRIREGEVHELGRGVRNCSRRARSLAPCPNQARALNGPVKPLQPKGQLVAHVWSPGQRKEVAPVHLSPRGLLAGQAVGGHTTTTELRIHILSTLGKSDTTVMVPMFTNIPSSIR